MRTNYDKKYESIRGVSVSVPYVLGSSSDKVSFQGISPEPMITGVTDGTLFVLCLEIGPSVHTPVLSPVG